MSAETLQDVIDALDARIRTLERHPDPGVANAVIEALQLIDRLHRPGITALYGQLTETEPDALGNEPAVRVLLELYDLVPQADRERVEEVLAILRPYVEVYGCQVDVLGVEDGVVHVAFGGPCAADAAAGEELRQQVEAALREGYPGFQQLVVEPADRPADRLWIDLPIAGQARSGPADSLEATDPMQAPPAGSVRELNAPEFHTLAQLHSVPADRARLVGGPGGSLLLVRLGREAFAYDPACPNCGRSLDAAPLQGKALECPWCSVDYDAGSGRRKDGERGHLHPHPVTVRGDEVVIAHAPRSQREHRWSS